MMYHDVHDLSPHFILLLNSVSQWTHECVVGLSLDYDNVDLWIETMKLWLGAWMIGCHSWKSYD